MLFGVAAAAVAMGVALLLAILFGPAADPRAAVGSAVIDVTPGPLKEWAIQTFGMYDKLFLALAVLAAIALIAALSARWETSRAPMGSIAIAAAGVAGCVAIVSRAQASAIDIIPTVVGSVAGIAVLRWLVRPRESDGTADHDPDRRRSLAALALLGVGVLSGVAGTAITRALHSVAGDRRAFTPPEVDVPAPPIPPTVQPKDIELPSFITPNKDFYRIDTALIVPQLSREEWQLRIHGMVDRDVTLTFDDLADLPVIEKAVTLTCVSNAVGGDLIGNARWTGYRTRDLLARAGIQPDADMVLSTSIDGFTVGTPVEALTDGRDSLLAITMNGEPLPTEHGYPARLVVPGLYGYVSATKWVVDLELTRFDRAQAYWTRLGWAAKAPIKTQSRIDVPRSFQRVPIGPARFGGVAWAQNRGVRAVEVRVDDADWQPANLAASYSNDTWRLWSFDWPASEPGNHTITVRAIDNTGAVQTEQRHPPMPDGATGWHTVSFSVA